MTARHILVTGATGGLGGAIVDELLARGHRVRATGRSSGAELMERGAHFVATDLARPEVDFPALLDGVDSVIHAAALSASWGPRADFEAANVGATERLLDACGAAQVRRFVFISSPSIFAAFRDRPLIGEDDAPESDGLNEYARTKLRAERMVLAHQGMACCAIRPRALVGPGDRVILPRLSQLASKPRVPLPRGGRALIELTDLRDAARAICDAEERADIVNGKAINISGGKPVSVRALASRLAAGLGRQPKFVDVPMAIARPLALMLEAGAKIAGVKSEPPLTPYTLATLAYTQTFDLEPARRLLDFVPRYDAVETLLAEARRMAAA